MGRQLDGGIYIKYTGVDDLPSGLIQRIHSLSEFENLIRSSQRLIIDFEAAWCGPCKKVGPIFDRLATEPGHSSFVFARVDVDECEEVAAKLNVSAMPTFIVFVNGQKVDQCLGGSEENLVAILKKHAQ